MIDNIFISPEIQAATKEGLKADPIAKEIDDISTEIIMKQMEIYNLQDKLNRYKSQRAQIKIKWRQSALWCLEVDKHNPRYFLKSTGGVYRCVAYKNKIDITPDIKNKVAVTLASLFKDRQIGRLSHLGTHYYGLLEFFDESLTELKEKYKKDLAELILTI